MTSSSKSPSAARGRRETPNEPTPATERVAATQPRKRILLVDDDPGVRSSLGVVLLQEGYGVWSATNGQEALDLAAANPFDLTVLDLNMPVKNGWDTFERLSWEHPLMPIILITARSNQLFTALGAGVGALLEKPLEIPLFLQTIARLLDEPGEMQLARLSGVTQEFTYAPRREPRDRIRPSAP
jgi:CheY-like chemotaxis protein